MANLETIENADTYLFADEITSKHNDIDNTEVMCMRWYAKTQENLLEQLEKIKSFGQCNSSEDSLLSSYNKEFAFVVDVAKMLVVNHSKEVLRAMQEMAQVENQKK